MFCLLLIFNFVKLYFIKPVKYLKGLNFAHLKEFGRVGHGAVKWSSAFQCQRGYSMVHLPKKADVIFF
jgi:hypothetical protein